MKTTNVMPFFTKYGHYVIAGLILGVTFTMLLNFCRRSVQFRRKERKEVVKYRCKTDPKKPTHAEDVNNYQVDVEHVEFAYARPTEDMLLERSFQFYKIADARRSLRFFSPDPISRDVIRNIIRAAGTSPSGAHTQPWTFVAVSNGKIKQSIRAIVEREEEINYKKRMGDEWTNDLKPLKTDWHKKYLTDAPWLILVFKQDYGVLPTGKRKTHYYKEMSVAIACGILITAIQYSGLVTLSSTPLNCGPAIRVLLERPVNEKLVLMLPVGYPAEDATVPALKRKDLTEILVEIE